MTPLESLIVTYRSRLALLDDAALLAEQEEAGRVCVGWLRLGRPAHVVTSIDGDIEVSSDGMAALLRDRRCALESEIASRATRRTETLVAPAAVAPAAVREPRARGITGDDLAYFNALEDARGKPAERAFVKAPREWAASTRRANVTHINSWLKSEGRGEEVVSATTLHHQRDKAAVDFARKRGGGVGSVAGFYTLRAAPQRQMQIGRETA